MANRSLVKGPARNPDYKPNVIKHNPIQIHSTYINQEYIFLAPTDCVLTDFVLLPADADITIYPDETGEKSLFVDKPFIKLLKGQSLLFYSVRGATMAFTIRTTHAPDTIV